MHVSSVKISGGRKRKTELDTKSAGTSIDRIIDSIPLGVSELISNLMTSSSESRKSLPKRVVDGGVAPSGVHVFEI